MSIATSIAGVAEGTTVGIEGAVAATEAEIALLEGVAAGEGAAMVGEGLSGPFGWIAEIPTGLALAATSAVLAYEIARLAQLTLQQNTSPLRLPSSPSIAGAPSPSWSIPSLSRVPGAVQSVFSGVPGLFFSRPTSSGLIRRGRLASADEAKLYQKYRQW